MNDVLTVSAADLLQALRAVSPHAAKPSSSHTLDVVCLEVVNGHLLVMATDRCVLAVWRVPSASNYPDMPTEFEATVMMQDVKRLIPFLRDGKNYPVTLSVVDNSLTVNLFGSVLRTGDVTSSFPAVERLVTDAIDRETNYIDAAQRGYDPAKLAKFAKAAGRSEAAVFHPSGPNKPGLVTVGENFIALVMPVRHPRVSVENWFATDGAFVRKSDARARVDEIVEAQR